MVRTNARAVLFFLTLLSGASIAKAEPTAAEAPIQAFPSARSGAVPFRVPHTEEDQIYVARVPPGYHVEWRASRGLILAGAATFGVLYAVGLPFAARDSDESRWLAAPVIGPWAALGLHRSTCDPTRDTVTGFPCVDPAPIGYFFSGMGQVVGAVILAVGLSSREQALVPDGSTISAGPQSVSGKLVPLVGPSGAGLALDGTF